MKKLWQLIYWVFNILYWYDCFKAWRRGERRVAPWGVRGHVYESRNPRITDLSRLLASGRFNSTIKPTSYYNAKEGRWYDIDEKGNRVLRKEDSHGSSSNIGWRRGSH